MMVFGGRISGFGSAMWSFGGRFAAETRGNIAMIFALTLPILLMITLGGVDINRAFTVRGNLQDALDAATLAAARSSAVTDKELTDIGMQALTANLANYSDISVPSATFTLNSDHVVVANATVNVKTLVANIVLPPYRKLLDDTLPVKAHSEVNRSSKNIEVGLVLDITGSMAGQRIADLKTAAAQLVDIVVQAQQTPYYTRMAIVPYSIGVNVGSYADGARGTPVGSLGITNILWSAGVTRTITAANKASTITITSAAHGFVNGDKVAIWNSTGMTQINGRAFTVANVSVNSFQLSGVDSRNYTSFSGKAQVARCLRSDCYPVVSAINHGIANDGYVYLTDIQGMTQLNGQPFQVQEVTAATYVLKTVGANTYTSGGKSWCGQYGCEWRVFPNPSGTLRAFDTSTCVSERTGAAAYTDASPSSAKVSHNYPSDGNPCPSAILQPLTSNKTTLTTLINGLTVTGSTAGQIGLAWGWYTVSPNFNSLWPSNPAGPNVPRDTLKAVILMTDGDFNSPYCTGVLAADSGSGSGDVADHINCNATNGNPFAQATALCNAIKAQSIVVYTVGFGVTAGSNAASILSNCATSKDYAFLPATGADLSNDFAAIGRDITRLRISK